MKKFLAIALIAASFAACNDGEKTTEETVSDTSTTVTPAGDTATVVTDTTTTVTTDTTVNN